MDIRITVADVMYPGPGKKQGQVVDQTGKQWYVWADKLHNYQKGGSYMIQKYKSSDFRGKTYYTIEEAQPIGGSPIPVREVPNTAVRLAPVAASDTERRMDIFICGAFNNIMANPNVNPAMLEAADMVQLVKRLKTTWLTALGSPPRTGSDLNDDLPDGM